MPTKEQRLQFRDLYEDQLRSLYLARDPRNEQQRIKQELEDKERGGA